MSCDNDEGVTKRLRELIEESRSWPKPDPHRYLAPVPREAKPEWSGEIVNATRINWRSDEETETVVVEFPRILACAKRFDEAVESLKSIVKAQTHLFVTGEFPAPTPAAQPDNYVAFLRYVKHPNGNTTIRTCDSDEPGAFKVYRAPTPAAQPESLVEAAKLILQGERIPLYRFLRDRDAWDEGMRNWEWSDLITAALRRALSTPQAGDGWVKVEERLPENNQAVLAFSTLYGVCKVVFEGDQWTAQMPDQYSEETALAQVTHWRALPSPPTQDGEK
jgi:hypothetical protein